MKTIDFAVEYLVRCGEPGARVVIRECIDELATLRDKLKEVEGEREAAEEERDAAVQSCHDMANNRVYHGNSVAWWHSKAAAYRDALGKCWDQLKAHGVYCDGNTHVATAIGKLGDDLTQARADLGILAEAVLEAHSESDNYDCGIEINGEEVYCPACVTARRVMEGEEVL